MTEKVQFVVTSEGWHDSFEDVSSFLPPVCLWCLISLAATQFDVEHKSKNADLVLVGWKSLSGAGKKTQPNTTTLSLFLSSSGPLSLYWVFQIKATKQITYSS